MCVTACLGSGRRTDCVLFDGIHVNIKLISTDLMNFPSFTEM